MKTYTIAEAARLLRVSRETLYRWKRLGLIEFIPYGKRQRVTESEIERVMKGE